MLLRSPATSFRPRSSRVALSLSMCAFALSGCQCNINDDDLNNIPDGGQEIRDAGPPPPTFPLKEGDQVTFPGLGGRTATCTGSATPGDCQRAMKATYVINSVGLNNENRWVVNANVVYEGTDDFIPATAIVPLVLDNGAPFSQVTEGTPVPVENAEFTTNTPATDQLTPNGFPFFQYELDEVNVFEEAGTAFCDRFRVLDPAANCDFQAANQAMEVFYKDEATAGAAKLHKVRAEYHQMGFICGWDEGLIPFVETMQRAQEDFGVGVTPDVAAIFASPIKLLRDGVTYNCSCFSQKCQAGNGAEAKCLSTDPNAAPGACN